MWIEIKKYTRYRLQASIAIPHTGTSINRHVPHSQTKGRGRNGREDRERLHTLK